MTAEVCVMNRHAAVLAADSATTVTRWTENGKEQRYFKGANKIFQLSDFHPLGLMIFASADLLSVPWEIIIKTFRKSLKDKSFNSIEGYAKEFFAFLASDMTLFPADVRTKKFIESARSVVFRVLTEVLGDKRYDHSKTHATKKNKELWSEEIERWKQRVAGATGNNCFDDADIEEISHKWKTDVEAALQETLEQYKLEKVMDCKEISALAISDLMKYPTRYLSETGLVFCGFGDKEIFPTALEFKLCGLIDEKLKTTEGTRDIIDHDTPATISAFAQTSMADTFTIGMSGDIYSKLISAVDQGLKEFADSIFQEQGIDPDTVQDLEEKIETTRRTVGQRAFESAQKEHAYPLRQVISSLPIDEMAELAETLINLQSLKEKVTKPTETVGGPVDVAVITKSEGLVWVKRKHYFPADINSRYQQRQNLLLS